MNKNKYIRRILTYGFWLFFLTLLIGKALGYGMYVVLSGSMEPKIKTGGIVVVQPISFEKLQEKDIVSFKGSNNQMVVTHRIKKIDRQKNILQTKGDANESADGSEVSEQQILGKVILSIPYIGYVIQTLQLRFLLLLGLLLTGFLLLRSTWKNQQKGGGE